MAGPEERARSWEFWLELVVGAGLGVLFLVLKKQTLAELTWIIAGFQTLGRFVYTRQAATFAAPVTKLAEIVDLQQECSVEELRTLHRLYVQITHDDFRRVKEAIIREATDRLSQLAHRQRSDVLATGEYYSWLLPMIEAAPASSEIWAVSMMLDCEWDDSPAERRFLAANLEAAGRGVRVQRVFVVAETDLDVLGGVPPVAAQVAPESKVDVLVVVRERLERQDAELLRGLGDGVIAFDRRVVLVDQHSQDGTARGYVTMNKEEIASHRIRYESLLSHAESLADAKGRRVQGGKAAGPIAAAGPN